MRTLKISEFRKAILPVLLTMVLVVCMIPFAPATNARAVEADEAGSQFLSDFYQTYDEYSQDEQAQIASNLRAIVDLGIDGELLAIERISDGFAYRTLLAGEIVSVLQIREMTNGDVELKTTENGNTDTVIFERDSDVLVNGELVHAHYSFELGGNAAVMSDAGSFFTTSNPLPSGRTWSSTVQNTTVCADIQLAQYLTAMNVATLAGVLGQYYKPLKAVEATATVAAKIIDYARNNGISTSKHLSYKTKVYYPNGGRRISANGVSPVRYAEKHTTRYYAKKNYAGGCAAKKSLYKITDIG